MDVHRFRMIKFFQSFFSRVPALSSEIANFCEYSSHILWTILGKKRTLYQHKTSIASFTLCSKGWFTIYARDGCEAARLRANSSEKVFTKHADVFTKFSCLRDFATRRADHQGVRPLVYRRIYNTQVYQNGKKNKIALACEKEDCIGFSFFVRCFVCASFLSSFSFSHFFFQIPIAAKIIEKLRHMHYLDFKIRYEVVGAPSPWKLDYLKNKRAVFTRKTTKEVQKKEEDEG